MNGKTLIYNRKLINESEKLEITSRRTDNGMNSSQVEYYLVDSHKFHL
jgi:hypothetical protein